MARVARDNRRPMRHKHAMTFSAALLTVASLIATACGAATDTEPTAFFSEPLSFDLSEPERGPHGNPAVPASEVSLSNEELARLKEEPRTAVHLWVGAAEWMDAVDRGATSRFEELNVTVETRAEANFDPAKQASDVETAMALDPDIVLALIVDPVSGAEAFRPVVESDKTLVLADNGAEGYEPGDEYVAIVTGDHFGMGQAAAELMADAIGGEGEIGMIFHDADFFVTNNRDNSFRAAIEQRFPDITILDAKGFSDQGATSDPAAAMIEQHPELDGIYVAWATAAEGVVDSLRAAGRDDVAVVTHDLSANIGLDMAQDGNVYGTVADLPFHLGETMATLAGYGILGKEAPPFVAVDFIKVTRNNLAEAWQRSLNQELPNSIRDTLN